MTDLFDAMQNKPPAEEEDMPEAENQVLAEVPAEEASEEIVESADEAGNLESEEPGDGAEEGSDENESATPEPDDKKPDAPKQVNVVEEDPYDFDKCQIAIALALLPDDGSPDGRSVVLGVRNHQDEPILTTCRLSDLMPLPDPVQQLLEQLKADLPARSEKASDRKKKAEEAKKKVVSAGKSKPQAKPATVKAKAEKPKATTMNLFDMFDQ